LERAPATVAVLGAKIDRLLVANGIIRPNKRTEDIQAYVRSYRAKKAHADRKEFEARHGKHARRSGGVT
jgi:hypothetical protein